MPRAQRGQGISDVVEVKKPELRSAIVKPTVRFRCSYVILDVLYSEEETARKITWNIMGAVNCGTGYNYIFPKISTPCR